MRQNIYSKFWFLILLCIIVSDHPISAQNQALQVNTSFTFHSKPSLLLGNGLRSSDKSVTKFNLMYNFDNLSSQLSFNHDGYNKFTFDGSYLQYTYGMLTYGVGAIERHWSFSNNSSLILSHNARPHNSIYLKLKDSIEYKWLPSKTNWSLEAFNGLTEGSLSGGKSILTGIRAILSPIEGLDFELVQTSQWGGSGYSTGISSQGAALFFDTNDGKNSNINKMAGFGISYSIPSIIMPFRIYGQAIGEDEAGNLPSCYAYLAGLEWINTKIKYPTTVSIEVIDTRVDITTNKNCGPNTMYNNSIYDYTNYGKSIGASIDTEGTSLGFHVQSKISQKINIKFVTKSIVINDNNWSDHRLSSKRQSGLISLLGVSWADNKISFNGDIYHEGLYLNKADIRSGYGIGFSSSIIF
jgi:hypothetical protein